MTGRWPRACLLTCGLVSGAIAALYLASPAEAQTLRPVITSDGPLPALRPTRPRRPDPAPADEAVPSPPPPALRPPIDDSADQPLAGTGDETQDPPPRPNGLRPATVDGDLSAAADGEQPVDGVADTEAAYENPDGADPVTWDARSGPDADAFERPPAGYDPSVFNAEIAPLLDRRTAALFRFEPWQQRGIRIGSFIVLPSVDIGAAGVSNIFRTKPASADSAFDLRPTLVLRSDWRRHALEFRATGGLSYFDKFPAEDDRAWSVEARGRLDITKLTQLTAFTLHDVLQESRGTLAQRLSGGARADVTTNQTGVNFSQRFNRLTIDLRGTLLQRDFAEVAAPDGTITSNRDRNLSAQEGAVRATWAFKPTLLAFAETALNQRRFDAASPLDGISRNSTGERYRVGVGFGNTSTTLRGEASVGWGQQTPDDQRLTAINGVLLDANLAWRIDGLNAMLLRASTETIETTLAGSDGGFQRRGSIEWRHAFLRPLIGTAGVTYAATDYQGVAVSENLAEYALGLEYYFGPQALVYGRVAHSNYRISTGVGNWDADEVRVGVRLRQ